MAGDTNSNIFINIDTSQAMAQLRALEKELTALNRALVVGTKTAAQAQAKYAQGLIHNVNATGQWTASMTKMRTASEQFATSLDRSRLSLKEYFRYGMASTKTFGRMFGGEFDTVSKLVEKRVKTLQQQYVQLGRDAQGAMNALKFTPKALNYRDVTTQLMLATQRQQIFNKLLDDGATKLLNFGKNTQWAGRQLMVGFTVPLMLFGTQAIRTFKEIETQIIRFKKVYGDIFTDPGQTDQALKNIRAIADEYTKYGVKVSDTIKMAADAAAAGNTGEQLQRIVEQTNKLAVLGGVTQEKALETTIALQNAFKIDSKDLDQTINFLNAVENQTVVALDDLTEAIPRVAPVVKQLGGDVKDLAFFMAAMQEGGISAAQGANALKSGLGSLINPSKKAAQAAADVGVNIKGIVEANQGNLRNIVVGFAKALEPLTDLQRTRVIEDVFGKYQFARISALLNNVTKDGTQAARVLQLANASVEELAILSERELGTQANSAMNKFVGSVERLKAAIAPVGEVFAKTLTPAIEFITKMAERFNKLPDGIKKGIAIITAVVGGLGPIFLMTFGLLANALANVTKGFSLLRKGYQSLAYGSSDAALKTQYLTTEELENISVTNSLYSSHDKLSASYRLESQALGALIAQYTTATGAMRGFSASNPGLFMPGKGIAPIRRAGGGTVTGPGTSTSDSIPAYLSDGEYVVNAKAVDKYGVQTFDAMNAQRFATGGMVTKNKIPRFFMGGWLGRALLPKQIVRAFPADGFELSGFSGMGGAARVGVKPPAGKEYFPSSSTLKSWTKIPWEENKQGLLIKDPVTGEQFSIRRGNKEEFDKAFNDLVVRGGVQKRGDRPAMSAGEYLIHRLYRYKNIKGGALTPTSVLGQAGSKGAARVRTTGATKGGAYKRWADRVDTPSVRKLQGFFDSERNHLRTVLPSDVFSELEKNNLFVVSPSHIVGAGKNRTASDWAKEKILRDTSLVNFGLNYMTRGKRLPTTTPHPTTQREADVIINAIEQLKAQGPLSATLQGTLEALKYRKQTGFYSKFDPTDVGLGLKMGGLIQRFAGGGAAAFLGMPTAFAKIQKGRMLAQQIDARVRSSRFKDMPVTDFGVLMKQTSGHSFPIPGVGGVYRKPNGDLVFVKPVMDEKAALAEQRATIIARRAHGLKAPKQMIKTMLDPTDPTRKRKFIVLESPYDPELGKGGAEFTKDQYFKQLVASTLRGDKDLSPENVFGGTLADVGTAGVFGRASGKRDYQFNMPSMAEQAMINLLGVKGGAKKAFAENTAQMIREMTPSAYQKAMIKEIDAVLPKLKSTIDSFDLTNVERALYQRMVKRLEAGKNVDWTKYYKIHSNVKPKKYAGGVFSVPGPKGAGDVVPAMLSPGEAVIPTAESEKYRPLIRSIIADKVPGFIEGDDGSRGFKITDRRVASRMVPPSVDPWGETTPVRTSGRERLRNAVTSIVRDKDINSIKNLGKQINIVGKESQTVQKVANGASKALGNISTRVGNIATSAGATAGARVPGDRTRGFSGYMLGYGKVPNLDPETGQPLTPQQRTNYRQMIRMNRTQSLMGPSMAIGAAGSMAMMYGMSKPDSFAGQNMNLIMGVTALAGILPLLNSPLKMMIASVVGLIAVYKMQSAQIKQSLLDGEAQAKAMSMTTDKLEALGKYTDKVSITQVAAAQRQGRTTEITPVNQTFGFNFLGSEAGKAFMSEFNKTVETMGTGVAAKNLANQLATAVQQGVLTADQAESIATTIARSLKDTVLEANLRGRLIELIGPDGINLTTNPYELNVKLMIDARELEKLSLNKLNKTAGDVNQGLFGIGGKQANLKPGGAIMGNPLKWSETAQLQGVAVSGTAASLVKAAKAARVAKVAAAAATGPETLGLGAVASFVIGEAITASLLYAARQMQRGEEKKVIAKVAGQLSGVVTQNISLSQQGIDAMTAEYNASIQNLEIRKKQAKTAKERADLEEQILGLEKKRDEAINKSRVQQAKIISDAANYVDKLQTDEAKNKYASAYKEQFIKKFKDDPFQKARAQQLTTTMEQAGVTRKATIQVQALVTSDQLTLGQAESLVTTLTADKGDLQKQLNLIVKTTGTEGLARFAEISQYLGKNAQKNFKNIVNQNLIRGYTKDVNDLYSGIEELIKLPDFVGIQIDTEVDPNDALVLEKLGRDANDLKKQFDGKSITLKALQSYQTELNGKGVTNSVLDTAIKNWQLLSSLDPNVRLQAMMTLTTLNVSDTLSGQISQEQKAAFLKTKRGQTAQGMVKQGISGATDLFDKEFNAFVNSAAGQKVAKDYIDSTMKKIFPPAKKDTVVKPTGTDTTGKNALDTSWLSDLLQRLKLLKETSIDATGTYKELLAQVTKFFGPNALASVNPMLDKQAGALKDIEKAAKDAGIALSTDFLDFINGLDAAQFEQFTKDFLKLTNGKITGFAGGTGTNSLFGQINEAFKTGTIAEFIKKQEDSITDTELQIVAFKKLTDATGEFKFDAIAAMEVLKDPALTKDIALGNKIFSKEERDAIIASINKTYKAASALSQIKMIQDTQSVQNQIIAFDKLTAAGYDYDTILKVIENDAYAYEIANDSVKGLSESTKSLVKDTNDYLNALKNLESTKFFQERTNALKLREQFAGIAPILNKLGVSLSDMQEILSNPVLAQSFIQDLKDGKLDAEQLQKYLNQIPKMKVFDLKIQLSTREGKEQSFNDLFSKAMEYYDILQAEVEDRYQPLLSNKEKEIKNIQDTIDGINKEIDGYERDIQKKQRTIETKFTRPINNFQEQISLLQKQITDQIDKPIESLNRTLEGLQRKEEINITRVVESYQRDIELLQRTIELSFDRPIAALQDESSNLANDLTLMDDQVRIINEKYDAQEKALKTISDINQEIVQQQQQQIGLADALTQGDISAAARAAQEMRNAAAAARAQNNTDLLAAGRQYEIDNLRTKSGMTRSQVEQRQFAINQQIYQLEQQREDVQAQILIKEDLIYQKEQERLPLQQQMRIIQDEIYNLELSRIPVQDNIYALEQQIYALEQQRKIGLDEIQAIEDTIYNIRVGKLLTEQLSLDNANAELIAIQKRRDMELEAIDAQRERWTDAKLAIDMAKIKAGDYNDVITIANDLTSLLTGEWTSIADGILAAVAALALYNAALKGGTGGGNNGGGNNGGGNDGNNDGNSDADKAAADAAAEAAAAEAAAQDAANAAAEAAAAAADAANTDLDIALASIQADLDSYNALAAHRNALAANAANLLAIAKKQGKLGTPKKTTPKKTTPKKTTGGSGASGRYANQFKSRGGLMKPQYFNVGGFARGADKIPAMLSPGEFIMSKYAVQDFGVDKLRAMNSGDYDSESVYNYSINVNVKSGANPDEIARAVMTQIKQVDSQRIRTQRV